MDRGIEGRGGGKFRSGGLGGFWGWSFNQTIESVPCQFHDVACGRVAIEYSKLRKALEEERIVVTAKQARAILLQREIDL